MENANKKCLLTATLVHLGFFLSSNLGFLSSDQILPSGFGGHNPPMSPPQIWAPVPPPFRILSPRPPWPLPPGLVSQPLPRVSPPPPRGFCPSPSPQKIPLCSSRPPGGAASHPHPFWGTTSGTSGKMDRKSAILARCMTGIVVLTKTLTSNHVTSAYDGDCSFKLNCHNGSCLAAMLLPMHSGSCSLLR